MLPGSRAYSLATVGCNFRCRFCQNADIAQMPGDHHGRILGQATTAEREVAAAVAGGCQSIAYTYTEPTVFFEFALDTAKLAHEKGLVNVFVTNGYMTEAALDMIHPYLDAANVDLKAYSDDFYKKQCGARLEPVKQSLKTMKALGIFVEVTTLLIPGLNDDEKELSDLATFLAEDLGPETPWHVSRFHPTYKLTDRPITPLETLLKAAQIGQRAGLRYIYVGNVPGGHYEDTVCHECGKTLIRRSGFQIRENSITNGACPQCQASVAGIGL